MTFCSANDPSNISTSTMSPACTLALLIVQHHHAVRLRHRAQDARALRAGDAHLAACRPRRATGCRAGIRCGRASCGSRPPSVPQQRQRGVGAHHAQQRLAREEVERHHHRHRIAGQPEQEGAVAVRGDAAEGQRAARAHADLPEGDVAQARHDLLGVVGRADRDAARGDDGVGVLAGLAQRRFQRLRVVAHHAHVDDVAAQALQHAVDGVAVAVVDAALIQRLADRAQFVAGREEGHAQAPLHRHLGHAERGQQAQVGRADDLPGLAGRRCRPSGLRRQSGGCRRCGWCPAPG
jgi:hypothetical protein